MRLGVVVVSTLLFVLGSVAVVVAQTDSEEFMGGKVRVGDLVEVPAGETVAGDLYVFAGNVTVAGDVEGDLIAFGGQIDISGVVTGDVWSSGGTVTISGEVAGDVRVAAGQVTVSADVGEDVVLGGGQTRMTGSVGNDLIFAAGQATVSGDVAGDVLARVGTYSLTGEVGGVQDIEVDEGIETTTEARGPVLDGVFRFISLMLFGALLYWLMRKPFADAVARIDTVPARVLGWGAIFLVGIVAVPLLAILAGVLLAIVFGIAGLGTWVGLFLFAMLTILVVYAFAVFLALAFVAPTTIGRWVGSRVLPGDQQWLVVLAVGVAILVVLGLIPVVGALVGLAVAIMGTGAWLADLRRSGRVAETEAALVDA